MHKKLSGPKMESQLRNTFGQSLIALATNWANIIRSSYIVLTFDLCVECLELN